MTRIPDREQHGMLVLIERMQRDGKPEHAIKEAVRQVIGGPQPERERPARRPGRFGLFGRNRRAGRA